MGYEEVFERVEMHYIKIEKVTQQVTAMNSFKYDQVYVDENLINVARYEVEIDEDTKETYVLLKVPVKDLFITEVKIKEQDNG